MTGFVKTPQSDLAIRRKVQKARVLLDLEGALLTDEVVRKAFVVAAKGAHPDSGEYNSEDYFKHSLEDIRKARNTLIEFMENYDDQANVP